MKLDEKIWMKQKCVNNVADVRVSVWKLDKSFIKSIWNVE